MLLQPPLEWEGAASGVLAATGTTAAMVNKATKTNGIRNLRMIHLYVPVSNTKSRLTLKTAATRVKEGKSQGKLTLSQK